MQFTIYKEKFNINGVGRKPCINIMATLKKAALFELDEIVFLTLTWFYEPLDAHEKIGDVYKVFTGHDAFHNY